MYCGECYADLQNATQSRCPTCGHAFDAADPRTFLVRPFPPMPVIIVHVVATTLFAIVAAWFVSLHQLARTSGH